MIKYRKSKKNAIKDSYDTVHNAFMHCKLQGFHKCTANFLIKDTELYFS
jgi:hypothetical protein